MDTLIKVRNVFYTPKGHIENISEFYWDFIKEKNVFDLYENNIVESTFTFNEELIKLKYESPISGEYITVNSNKLFELHKFGSDNSYFPGEFNICCVYKGKQYIGVIRVASKTYYGDGVFNLRKFVNDFYSGLSLDLNKRRKTSIEIISNQEVSKNSFTNYSYIEANHARIINRINEYIKKQPGIIIKKHELSKNLGRIDANSLKWLAKKGNTKNIEINNPETILASKAIATVDFSDNRIFKSIVNFWFDESNALIVQYKKIIEMLIISKTNELANEKRANDKLAMLSKEENKFGKEIIENSNIIKDATENIHNLEELIKNYENRLNVLKRFSNNINRMLNYTWLNRLNVNKCNSNNPVRKEIVMMKDEKEKYLESKHRKTIGGYGMSVNYFAEKSTPKLFETYVFVLLIRALENVGFFIESDSDIIFDLMYVLSFQSTIRLTNSQSEYCDIIYDRRLEKYSKNIIENDYCSINSSHNKPDFILSFHNAKGERVKTLIFEVKWRNFKYIYDIEGDTKVVENLRDYLNLGYCVYENNKCILNKGVVDKVFVIHPDYEENVIEIVDNNIYSVGLKIDSNILGSKGFRNIVDSFIVE